VSSEVVAAPRRGRPPARNEVLRANRLGGCVPEELAAEFGTPFFAYDFDVVERQVTGLREVLPTSFDLAYAVKSNPSLGVVGHLATLGVGADVASAGELATARAAGVPGDRIVMTGPGKRDDELAAAVDAAIRVITVESLGELRRLEAIAATRNVRVPILLRANATAAARFERVRIIGDEGAGKFGMGAEDLLEAACHAVRSPYLDPLGVHSFGASNILDAGALADHVASTVAFARTIATRAGFPLRLVDAGGGLGIPYETDEEPLDLAEFGRRLATIAAELAGDPVTRDTRVLLEPGRYLVGPAGAYVARVVDRKVVDGRDVAILDGGIHHVLRPVLVGQEHRVRRLAPAGGNIEPSTRFAPVNVAGPLCTGLDVLATQTMLHPPQPGDLVAVLDVGAYGFTESMPFFLSHPIPAEVAVRGGRARLLRPRLEPATWLGWQSVPDWSD